MGENEFFLRNIKDSGDFFGKQYDPDAEFWAGLKEIIKDMYDDYKEACEADNQKCFSYPQYYYTTRY